MVVSINSELFIRSPRNVQFHGLCPDSCGRCLIAGDYESMETEVYRRTVVSEGKGKLSRYANHDNGPFLYIILLVEFSYA